MKRALRKQRVLQLAEAEQPRFALVLRTHARLPVALVEHHLLAVMRPALDVSVCTQQLAHFARRLRQPQELHVVAGIGLMHRGGDDGADVERVHIALDLGGRHFGIGQRDVEVSLGGVFFEGAGRIHAGGGGGAHEGRGLFKDGLDVGWDGDDVVRADEADEAVEGGAERIEQLVRGGMVSTEIGEHGARVLAGFELSGHFPELLLIFAQVGPADFEQLVERHVDHLVVLEFFAERFGADAEVAIGARQQVAS